MNTLISLSLTPSDEAIATAIKNGIRDGAKYQIDDLLSDLNLWKVARKGGDLTRVYLVDTELRTCQCEAFRKSGVCKHQYIVDEEIQIRQMEEAIEAREFMLETSREHNVGFSDEMLSDLAGAWH